MAEVTYRDFRNGRQVDSQLARIYRDCAFVTRDLAELANILSPDIELTPEQADQLTTALGRIGALGGSILTYDLTLTTLREMS
jgi:hypothetical protein